MERPFTLHSQLSSLPEHTHTPALHNAELQELVRHTWQGGGKRAYLLPVDVCFVRGLRHVQAAAFVLGPKDWRSNQKDLLPDPGPVWLLLRSGPLCAAAWLERGWWW